jgi:23S rRNA pseudouridine955/2504/2580 synthase
LKRVSILFENDDCIVLNKPAGLPVQGGVGVGTSLDTLLAEEWSPRPLLVHRLDRDTSGLIRVAKNPGAAARFSALFAGEGGRGVVKRYLAVCVGRPAEEVGLIQTDLDVKGSVKRAETGFKRLAGGSLAESALGNAAGDTGNGGGGEFSLLELELGTGRMHQIRRHLALTGLPILGDDKYGNFALNKALRKTRGLRRLLLHASRLIIGRESLGYALDISAPLPEYFFPFAKAE